jgi:uncharacterized protein YkwD
MIGTIVIFVLGMTMVVNCTNLPTNICIGTQADLVNGILNQSNICRACHGLKPLTKHLYLSNLAANWSQWQATNNTMMHNPYRGSNVGENIYASWASNPSAPTTLTCFSNIIIFIFFFSFNSEY